MKKPKCIKCGKEFSPRKSGMREFCVKCRKLIDYITVGIVE